MTASLDFHAERLRMITDFRPGQSLPDFPYSSDEHVLWTQVFTTLRSLHTQHSCARYREAARLVELPATRVPQLSDVSRMLQELTGFQLEPAVGALPGNLFYGPLADGVLNSTPDVRSVHEQSFSPSPDVIHELVGHAVMLADPDFADLYRWVGRAYNHADTDAVRAAVTRVFWFTMEVGLVAENGRPRAYGAAILSSAAEMESFASAELRKFRIDDVIASNVDDQSCQRLYYVAGSMSEMMDEVQRFLEASVSG